MSDPLNPYAALYDAPSQGPGDARPTAMQVVKDNDVLGKWQGRVALVTGGTSGIGIPTAQALHATGADVYFTARDLKKAEPIIDQIRKESPGHGKIEAILMDMNSLESVKKAAAEFLNRSRNKLNVLVNNAGIMAPPKGTTQDGFESQFGVNHLAHFALTVLLLPALAKSSTPEFNSRVVNVTSSAHRFCPVVWDDFNFDKPGAYQPYGAYGQSKTANIWTANYIDRVYGALGVHATSVHPGAIWSGLYVHADEATKKQWASDATIMAAMQTPEQGAATSIWAAVGKVWEGRGGKYLATCRVAPPTDDLTSILSTGVASHAYDVESEDRLWKLSEELTGLKAAL
ncbi:putative short-chain dehydrogenase [Cercophora newfieldiana]|uniref:Short-chain dehydrogenase n=1 Tax=Cercophora newfieldiana TaxID=92897 RepID=A0AA39XTC7_9PEZI|nr:putative short-chain dehydrogenase [Cercophora newfieldiana]